VIDFEQAYGNMHMSSALIPSRRHVFDSDCAGTATDYTLRVIETLCAIAQYGAVLMIISGGDLAGWLGDLAPRGDLTSTQLLYRTCCFSQSFIDYQVRPDQAVKDAMAALRCAHNTLVPLVALTFEAPPFPPPEVAQSTTTIAPPKAAAEGGVGKAWKAAPTDTAPSKAAASKAAAAKAWEDVEDAIFNSPAHLVSMYDACRAKLDMLSFIISLVETRLYQPHAVPRLLTEPAPPRTLLDRAEAIWHQLKGPALGDYISPPKLEAEPLAKLLQKQRLACFSSSQGYYSTSEEARHVKRLQAYVQAAADRAAEQLQGQPALVHRLREVIKSV
jgi:hypothetical protein